MKKISVVLDRAMERVALAGAILAGVALVGSTAFMIYEITLRWMFETSTFLVGTVVGYGMALMTFAPLGYALRENNLIRVSLVLNQCSPRQRWFLELAVTGIGIALTAFLVHFLWLDMTKTVVRGTMTADMFPVPLWITPAIILFGLAILLLQLILRIVLIGLKGTHDVTVPAHTDPL